MLILASASPRRREILANAGLRFRARPARVEEIRRRGEGAEEYARRLAWEKAHAIPLGRGEVILAADTIVLVDKRVLQKPSGEADARRMLRALSGRWHEVLTAYCLRSEREVVLGVERTRVHFLRLSRADIDDYVAGGEPLDKAGAYAIQGLASKFIDCIEGCYFNVVGLPVARVAAEYRRISGIE
ncbi:MAG: Maf family protein [Bryobacteraceae bacterium]